MKMRVIVVLGLSCLLFGCAGKRPVSEPPKGYSGIGALKMAYATGRLKLVKSDFPVPEDLVEYKDVTYKQVDGTTLKLDIYRDKQTPALAPLILFVHGGSWKKGNKHDYFPYMVDYAHKGYVTASVQYRLSPVAKFPTQMEDVDAAVKWLKAHARDYGIDPDKVALVGGSAGGHLVMMQAYTANDRPADQDGISGSVQAVVNLYGPSDLAHEEGRHVDVVALLVGKSYAEAPEAYEAASPIRFIDPEDPPTLIFHGSIDELVPIAQSDRLDEKLKENGVPSEYHRLEGWPHTMDASVKVNAYCQYYMDRFFERYIPK